MQWVLGRLQEHVPGGMQDGRSQHQCQSEQAHLASLLPGAFPRLPTGDTAAMRMRSIWNGVISFGLVTIPVRLYTATESHDVNFHLIHKTDGARTLPRKRGEEDLTQGGRDSPEIHEDRRKAVRAAK